MKSGDAKALREVMVVTLHALDGPTKGQVRHIDDVKAAAATMMLRNGLKLVEQLEREGERH